MSGGVIRLGTIDHDEGTLRPDQTSCGPSFSHRFLVDMRRGMEPVECGGYAVVRCGERFSSFCDRHLLCSSTASFKYGFSAFVDQKRREARVSGMVALCAYG
jgi:hypothetical protein